MSTRSATLGLVAAAAAVLAWGGHVVRPAGLPPSRVSVAFWAWQARTPSPEDVRRAVDATGARNLFLRAGQFDLDGANVVRIRAVEGAFPAGVDVHLVYNATPTLLDAFERLEPATFAAALSRVVTDDAARAARDGARAAGVQLDLDAPTRLLPHYAELLRAARAALPTGLALSVTGLPTWTGSRDLATVLDAVDFWIPQCYGAEIPERVDRRIAIAEPEAVGRAVARAESLGRPYWVGLAAYGYAVRYARDGRLAELRGDVDPAAVARVVNLEPVERRSYDRAPGEWRCLYRATAPCAVDGLALEAGEFLLVDAPSAAWLRECSRAARERAGPHRLGVCIFRLPTEGDATALTLDEMCAALADRDAEPAAVVRAENRGGELTVEIANAGSAGPVAGDGALAVDVRVPPGAVRSVALDGFDAADLLAAGAWDGPRPSSIRRANVVRLRAASWRPGEHPSATLRFAADAPASVEVEVVAETPGLPPWRDARTVEVTAP